MKVQVLGRRLADVPMLEAIEKEGEEEEEEMAGEVM